VFFSEHSVGCTSLYGGGQVLWSPCVCVSVRLSVCKVTHKRVDGCQLNLVNLSNE